VIFDLFPWPEAQISNQRRACTQALLIYNNPLSQGTSSKEGRKLHVKDRRGLCNPRRVENETKR